jgi:ADP-ribose pyrophosphatase
MKDSDCSRSDLPQVLLARPVFTTPWCRLIEKTGRGFDAPYYVLHTSDYVTVLAITDDDRLVLVRQWRPALEAFSLELPSGHLDPGEQPEDAARRELIEETGLEPHLLRPLGALFPDTGRLGNRLWGFFARVALPAQAPTPPEPGIEMVLRPRGELAALIRSGTLQHALDLSVCLLAVSAGHLRWA